MSSKPKKNSSSKKNDTKSSTKKNTLSSKASKGKATKKEEQIPTITIETKPPKFPLPPQPKNFKQLEYKVDENKLYLVDYNNNTFECNLYGNALPTFNDKISGKATYTTRNTLLNNKQQFSFEYNQLYHPITQNFEGYSPYPRPLSLPFINECSNPTLFIKQLSKENRFTTSKNKNIIKLKLPSKDKQFKLTYLTSSIHLNEQDTKKYLLKLIDNYINDLIKENPYYEERVMKSPNVKALLRFQKILKLNMDANVVNGKSIQPAPKEYKETFDIINTVRRRNVLTRPNSSKKINENVYKVMYSIRTVPKHYYQTLTETVSRNTTLSPTKSTLETKSRVDTKMGYEDNKTIRSIKLDNVTTYTKTTGFGLTTVNRFCKGNDDTQKYFEDLNNKENLSFCKYIYILIYIIM